MAFFPETRQCVGVWLRRGFPSRGPEGQGPPAHRSQCLSCWSQLRRLASWEPLPLHGGHRSPAAWRTGTPLSQLHGAPWWPNDRRSPKCAPHTSLLDVGRGLPCATFPTHLLPSRPGLARATRGQHAGHQLPSFLSVPVLGVEKNVRFVHTKVLLTYLEDMHIPTKCTLRGSQHH